MTAHNAESVCCPSDVPPPKMSLVRRAKFWRYEAPVRLRSWWRRHWWPARIRQLDRERADWKRWCQQAQEEIAWLRGAQSDGVTGGSDER